MNMRTAGSLKLRYFLLLGIVLGWAGGGLSAWLNGEPLGDYMAALWPLTLIGLLAGLIGYAVAAFLFYKG
ncbi:MAG: hypothetical protein U0800_14015 [Isosphaeraceae bacterium]